MRRARAKPNRRSSVWKVSEAKSKLSEVLNRARETGPQIIGARNQRVVVSREEWEAKSQDAPSLARWLVENSPKVEIELPERGAGQARSIPFAPQA